MVLVSIIIPVFNGESYIREAIESALAQPHCEVIVVNDGSTDQTATICMEYDDIKYYYKENGGTASALNVGIHFANGEYIKWLSADDVLLGNAIASMIGYIGLHDTDPENTIYYTNYHIINSRGDFKSDFKEPGHDSDKLWQFFFGNGSTTLIHKEIFQKIGDFDSGLPHSEDYEFWLRATMLHGIKMQLIPIFTINYRNHPDQLTHKVGGKLDKVIKQAIRKRMG